MFPQIMCFCMTAIPCAFAAYFGANYIQGIINMLSGKVLTVFQIIGGLMPALGIAITLQYIFKGGIQDFLICRIFISRIFRTSASDIRYHRSDRSNRLRADDIC